MQDEDGFEVCEIHPWFRLIQPQGELHDVCLVCEDEKLKED